MAEHELLHCEVHGETMFHKHKNGNAKPRFKCGKCSSEATARVVAGKQKLAYEKYGSCCRLCGYDKCTRALEWHHIDPNQKEVEPKKVFSRSWERIQEELDKCVLLCANCHREVHAGLVEIPWDGWRGQ